MMTRNPRVVAVGAPHHVTQRGNDRRDVFSDDRDRNAYLDAFFEYAAKYDLAVWAYCLMRNHVHFIVVPHRAASLARVFGRTHADYARYANIVRRGCGHLWQARFYSCPLDGAATWQGKLRPLSAVVQTFTFRINTTGVDPRLQRARRR